MNDQATRLRQIIESKKHAPANKRIITVTSGKGGVGKTNIAVNLASNLAKKGQRVLVIDADFGLSNVDVLFGCISTYDLSSVIRDGKDILEVVNESENGVKFISGGSGVLDLINLEGVQLQEFLDKMSPLDDIADIVIFDTGAGINENILRLVAISSEVVIVTTSEPTAIMDAYALAKTIHRMGATPSFHLVVNRAETPVEAQQTLNKFSYVIKRYLGLDVNQLGYILSDNNVRKAVQMQTPFVISYPNTIASKNIDEIANNLMGIPKVETKQGLSQLLGRLLKRI